MWNSRLPCGHRSCHSEFTSRHRPASSTPAMPALPEKANRPPESGADESAPDGSLDDDDRELPQAMRRIQPPNAAHDEEPCASAPRESEKDPGCDRESRRQIVTARLVVGFRCPSAAPTHARPITRRPEVGGAVSTTREWTPAAVGDAAARGERQQEMIRTGSTGRPSLCGGTMPRAGVKKGRKTTSAVVQLKESAVLPMSARTAHIQRLGIPLRSTPTATKRLKRAAAEVNSIIK